MNFNPNSFLRIQVYQALYGGNILGGRERRGNLDRQELHQRSFVKLRIHLTYYYIGFYIYYINLFIKRGRKLDIFFYSAKIKLLRFYFIFSFSGNTFELVNKRSVHRLSGAVVT